MSSYSSQPFLMARDRDEHNTTVFSTIIHQINGRHIGSLLKLLPSFFLLSSIMYCSMPV